MEETKGKLKEKKTKQALFYNKIGHVICHCLLYTSDAADE